MRPWQNALALAAVLLASGALLPLAPQLRVFLAGLAIALIFLLLALRLRAHAARRGAERTGGVYDRIERIRAERDRRTCR